MIPFSHTWPYETIGEDIYVQACPFCDSSNVMLPLQKKDLADIQSGVKRLLVFPCCRNRLRIVDADRDYLLASKPLRQGQ
ncbi:hypothetical protein RAC89_16595 [Paenibacillus sp. GD4]|jgi:hypothetical protein|uniref:hypothetical protein n=1 Tax=Paenibacillus TaxID=44249 RepID=UPI00254273F5|nr:MULTISPECIES: hypothetical protein [Paenibacillus]MDQ1912004.1 hypothetical protein [Paenibacillus sp. GD4]